MIKHGEQGSQKESCFRMLLNLNMIKPLQYPKKYKARFRMLLNLNMIKL